MAAEDGRRKRILKRNGYRRALDNSLHMFRGGTDMKRLVKISLLMIVMLLVACKEDTNEPKPIDGKDDIDIIDDTEDEAFEERKADADFMAASTLFELERMFGYLPDYTDFYENEYNTGIAYAQLVDFNQDKINELVVLYKWTGVYDSYEEDKYIMAIYGDTGESYTTIYERDIPIDECMACDLSLGLIEFKDGTYGFYESAVQTAQGVTFSNETIYFVTDEFNRTDKTLFTAAYGETTTYEIDGEEIAEEEFEAQRELYNGNVTPILDSYFGTKSFAFELGSSAQRVAAILDEVMYVYGDINEIGEEIDAATVQSFVERGANAEYIDTNVYEHQLRMISYVMLYEDLEADLPSYEYYTVMSEQLVRDKVQEVFGVDLDLSNLYIPDPFEEDVVNVNRLYGYHDQAFYIVPTDFNSETIIRTAERAWKIGEDLYYIEVSDIQFDDMGYWDTSYEVIDGFINQPYEQWPMEAKKWAVSGVRNYLLVQLVDGSPRLKVVNSGPMFIDLIKEFYE